MLKIRKPPAERVMELLPTALAEEIYRLASCRAGGTGDIREIMLRCDGLCQLVIGRERLPLYHSIDRRQTDELVSRLIDGALYAHRDSIASGYISIDGGIRVGLCGSASYDGGRLVGVSDMRSLLFRIPSGRCDFIDELYDAFNGGIGQGMLIYSPPGLGKTTALRSLAHKIGSGASPRRVCVVDERCEFSAEDYCDCQVDILKGYKRREGIEIATRTLSPDLIIIDEIGADDAEALLGVVRCGIPLVATAHAGSFNELEARPALRGLFTHSVFSAFVGIYHVNGEYRLSVDRI
ncbi:MAG: AAA family ATPase [Clostridia bacterium]|nr:AAA family ATPase [Clostridia bacterium]